MKYRRTFAAVVLVLVLFSAVMAQKPEVTVTFNEPFFDALLDSAFQNLDPIEFPLAASDHKGAATFQQAAFSSRAVCPQTVRILREINGVRTATRFREGKIYVPIAFTGSYSPPFVGCVEFSGWAESNIDLEFDQAGQRLIGRIRVLNVNLNGTGGVGGTVVARLIQTAIDKRYNPLEIISLERMSFLLPIRGTRLKARAVSARPELGSGLLTVRIGYVFEKG